MVTAVTNLGRSGVYDWLIQRVTAVVLTAYTFFIVGFILSHPDLSYGEWQGLFDQFWVRIFSLLAIISVAAHAWIGLWVVLTDYVTSQTLGGAGTAVRLILQVVLGVVTVAYAVWGIEILWGF
ncbi:succinate dehydrogenase, hydrophobic membrane anchor protein [Gilvimarinus sp. F26214L]|uniref:succinate dehydrogenase, hydrophobic membrane anchor protein n=1 Tax=Gilvimarinus sp. DZF01 TaxID=3461371 RepID=UPI00404659AB